MREYLLDILALLRSDKSKEELLSLLDDYHEADLADALENLKEEERPKFYELFDEEVLSEIFAHLDDASIYLKELGLEQAAEVIEEMDSSDAVEVLADLEEEERDELLALIEDEVKEDIELIASYDEDELGSIMTNNYIVIKRGLTVKQAMRAVIEEAAENDNVSIIYVVEDNDLYYGTIDLRDLFIARADTPLETIIKKTYPTFYATDLIEDAHPVLTDYALESYPVLDQDNQLIGVITSQLLVDMVTDELNDDFAKLAGLSEESEITDSLFKLARKRVPWLVILLVLGLITSLVISGYEEVVGTIPIIVFFQSLVLGMSGNAGTQSLAVTLQSISDMKLSRKNTLKILFKEMGTGLIIGTCLGLLAFGIIMVVLSLIPSLEALAFKTAFSVGVSLLVSMTSSAVVGSAIPLILTKIKVDPAVASGPFITTLNDIIAIVIYYSLATILFLGI